MKYRSVMLTLLLVLCCAGRSYSDGLYTKTDEEVNHATVYLAHLTLHPTPEPAPALKYRLITDPAYQLERDASTYYLKALGFFEMDNVREEIRKKYRETEKYLSSKDPQEQRKWLGNWSDLSPDELPLEEVKKILPLLRFQTKEFANAERCRFADFGHEDVFESESPYEYLLPEMQDMRELARWQSVRCKVALREGRIDDAVRILRQQYMHSMHLGQDIFIVGNLIGIAISGIANQDLFYLIQEPEAPSLYWAVAAIPRPLCDMQKAIALEKRLMRAYSPHYEKLRDLDYRFPKGFWVGFTEEFGKKMLEVWRLEYFGYPSRISEKTIEEHFQTFAATFVIAAYPKAKRYLVEDIKLDRQKVDALPAVRVVAMAMDYATDDLFEMQQKYLFLPTEQAIAFSELADAQFGDRISRIGIAAFMPATFVPAVFCANRAVTRQQQEFNVIQTIEALRIHAYHHQGKLPESLEGLNPPAMKNPFTGKHFPYRLEKGKAILDAPGPAGIHRRYVIEMKP